MRNLGGVRASQEEGRRKKEGKKERRFWTQAMGGKSEKE